MSDPLFHQLYESYHLQILSVTNEMQLHQLHDSLGDCTTRQGSRSTALLTNSKCDEMQDFTSCTTRTNRTTCQGLLSRLCSVTKW